MVARGGGVWGSRGWWDLGDGRDQKGGNSRGGSQELVVYLGLGVWVQRGPASNTRYRRGKSSKIRQKFQK